jgi:hypothetical protein
MNSKNLVSDYKQLDSINATCNEIKQVLIEHLDKTTNEQYKSDIEKDLVTLENLKLIMVAVKEDIELDKVGACTELVLRIAANDFKNKLNIIPEKKTLIKMMVQHLNELHRNILHFTIRRAQ